MELATALVWALRIVLPVILFCIYFKLQAPKDGDAHSGPTGHQYSRATLLQRRQVVASEPVPDDLSNVTMVDATQAPHLFEASPKRRAKGGGRDKGGKGGGKGGGEGEDGGKGAGKQRRPRSASDLADGATKPEDQCADDNAAVAAVVQKEEAAKERQAKAAEDAAAQDKLHLESLLNYVAFNHREQQRTFLIAPDSQPPPPPRKRVAAESEDAVQEVACTVPSAASSLMTSTKAGEANAEAQMVLTGALRFARSHVAKSLLDTLVENQVEVAERTFTLMIESCVHAADLKGASDLLLKMEAAGHCPDTDLLDRVMDLYALNKASNEREKAEAEKAKAAATHAQDQAAQLQTEPSRDKTGSKESASRPASPDMLPQGGYKSNSSEPSPNVPQVDCQSVPPSPEFSYDMVNLQDAPEHVLLPDAAESGMLHGLCFHTGTGHEQAMVQDANVPDMMMHGGAAVGWGMHQPEASMVFCEQDNIGMHMMNGWQAMPPQSVLFAQPGGDDGQRTKLRSNAGLFVPTFGAGAPSPMPPVQQQPPPPPLQSAAAAVQAAAAGERSSLKASAKSFMPQVSAPPPAQAPSSIGEFGGAFGEFGPPDGIAA